MEENFSFGYWLRRQRLARDLRQGELAAQLGIARVTLRKIEADERRPSLQLIERVAAVFALGEHERATLLQVARADLAPAALPLPERAADLDALPSGTLTFLFTDIEGSTRHWEQQPDAMRLALTQHNQLLQQAIADGGGTLVKHTGDGMLAVFTRCEHAVAAAVAAQRLLVANEWPTGQPLLVRMAMHTGTVELQGQDYVGPALNRAARLLAAGHGGQILLSLAAAELSRDHLPASVTLRELGSYRLRDLARPEQV
ncbi:MAG TPA: helix-turn-helix domain-containing protein, partial [Roseiflexaceae bacterium]|nr:helix-turn-helix domain-containing protein [Roseiflexaceae bacterium]